MKCSNPNTQAQQAAAKFPQRLKEVHEGRIVLRDDAVYKGCEKHIEVKCTVCAHEWNPAPKNLVNDGKGCPQCFKHRKKAKSKAGELRAKNSTPEERQRAQELRSTGLTLAQIADIMDRSFSSIRYWCDQEQHEKRHATSKQWVRENRDTHNQMVKEYAQTEMGSMVMATSAHQRRGLEYHAIDSVLIDGVWHDYDCYQYITTAEDKELWSFTGADEDVAKRKKQQIKLAKISGESYSLEHLVPLSRGGLHAPENFANRALALNLQKNNSIWSKDLELFAARLFK